jgi:hypothetical protein
VIRNKAFDMTSDGARFSLYIPSRDAFIQGSNEIVQRSENRIENLRPQHFVDALMVRPVDPAADRLLHRKPHRRAWRLLHRPRDSRREWRLRLYPHDLVQPREPGNFAPDDFRRRRATS